MKNGFCSFSLNTEPTTEPYRCNTRYKHDFDRVAATSQLHLHGYPIIPAEDQRI